MLKSKKNVFCNLDKKQAYKLQKRISNIESKIARTEKEIKQLREKLGLVEYNSDEYDINSSKIKDLEEQLTKNISMWEEFHK